MSGLGDLHYALGVFALATGLAVALTTKGTARHRRLGRTYAISMLLLNGTALGIYRLYGYFGPFHVAAVISLVTLCAAYVPVFLRRPSQAWLHLHAHFMAWSYAGLLAAFASEVAVRVFHLRVWPAVVVATISVLAMGAVIISLRVPRLLKQFESTAKF